MAKVVTIGSHSVGEGCPTFIVGEIGINHNGDLNIAKQ
jgi:N-acetylneuraminate synthase